LFYRSLKIKPATIISLIIKHVPRRTILRITEAVGTQNGRCRYALLIAVSLPKHLSYSSSIPLNRNHHENGIKYRAAMLNRIFLKATGMTL
jgi:hypothetical protein